MSWAPGTIILCVDDSGSDDALRHPWVVAGQYYTVRNRCHCIFTGEPGVRLEEITMDACPFSKRERGWRAARFIVAESTHSESERARQMSEVRV